MNSPLKEASYITINYNNLISHDKESIEIFKKSILQNRMVVISNVAGLSNLRRNHFEHSIELLNVNPTSFDSFSNGIKVYHDLVSFMAPIFFKDPVKSLEKLNLNVDEFPDYNHNAYWPNIPGFRESSETIAKREFNICKELFSLVEADKIKNNYENTILHKIENAENFLTRTIVIKPTEEENTLNSPSVAWHYDKALFSLHFKDYYYQKEGDKYVEVENPKTGGLIFRDADGNDFRLELKDDEMMIQFGLAMQVLSSNEYKAQAHCVLKPQNKIGRVSNIVFVYPMYETPIMPLDYRQKNYSIKEIQDMLLVQEKDREVIKPILNYENHWYENVPWIIFSQNQLIQFNLGPRFRSLPYTPNLKIKRWKLEKLKYSIIDFNFDKIDSTHKTGEEFSPVYIGKNSIVVLTADQQSGGVGQGANTWSSPKGNLYFTCVIKHDFGFNKILLPQTTAIATKKCLEHYAQGKTFDLKWINDVFYKDKKIAGILISSSSIPDSQEDKFVISVGINLNTFAFEGSTYLKEIIGREIDLVQFKKDFILFLSEMLENLKTNPNSISIYLNKHLMNLGKEVNIWDEKLENIISTGIFQGVDNYGQAILKQNNGESSVTINKGRMRPITEIKTSCKLTFSRKNYLWYLFLFGGGVLSLFYFKKFIRK
jgi:BirA family transcriptional regulator, biotin operon repressor / biotin---[acetyl-CoA-carboxylase] ligase